MTLTFIYQDDKIYVHGLNKGQKLDNIKRNPKVCFEADEMIGLLLSDSPCDVNTEYNSVVALGTARLIEDSAQKIRVLEQIMAKYTPSVVKQGTTTSDGKYHGNHRGYDDGVYGEIL